MVRVDSNRGEGSFVAIRTATRTIGSPGDSGFDQRTGSASGRNANAVVVKFRNFDCEGARCLAGGVHEGIVAPVAGGLGLRRFALEREIDASTRGFVVTDRNGVALYLYELRRRRLENIRDDVGQVLGSDGVFSVPELNDARQYELMLAGREIDAEALQVLVEGGLAGELSEGVPPGSAKARGNQRVGVQIAFRVAVGVDARGLREDVSPDDGSISGDLLTTEAFDQA